MMTGNDLVSAFRKGEFEVDCIQMQLAQNKSEKPVVYSGRGFIRLTEAGHLEFKIYADSVSNTTVLDSIKDLAAAESGKIYDDTDFFTLNAIDLSRNNWSAENILPRTHWPGPDALPHIQGSIQILRCTGGHFANPRLKHFLRLHFFDEAEIPCPNTSVDQTPGGPTVKHDNAKFEVLGCEFLITKSDAEIIVETQSDTPFAPYFEARVTEGLQFILARSLSSQVLVRSDEGKQSLELSSAVPKAVRIKLDPPLASGYQGYLEHSWQLFSLYVDYITKANRGRYWHTCSYHLHNACEASANSLDAWAVGVCVAVEGISSLVDVVETDKEKKAKKDIAESLTEFIDSQKWDVILTKRAKGLLGQLQNLRVIDRLETLQAIGHVDAAHIKAWSKLRNKQAHPKHADLGSLRMDEIQGTLDLVSKTTVLMYHIVFHLIGYRGKYVDYGTYRYPVKDYPLESPPGT